MRKRIVLSTIAVVCALALAAAAKAVRSNVARLNHGLAGTPLAGYGATFDRYGRRWNVSPFFVASIAGVESSFGAAACGGNAWGIGSCATSFGSFTDGIAFTTKLLRVSYIDRGMRDLWSIGTVFCPPCGNTWGDHVAWFLTHRFGAGLSVTYG